MKISETVRELEKIKAIYGDIRITGGQLMDDSPLSNICVTDVEGMEVYPRDPNGVRGKNKIDGVFLT
ncbi:hypothetical protein [Mesorhizobium sp. NZP2298]|uniref:hypothetical protein n=1 Tax=Mesorhizobium sp. NZP2298 TaxID=2483403 RepID=UPI0015537753|nr:hypothetical protein [Mesorhizobium sp. NZP2298]QKC99152.1 hypothetical protein EB231_34745 [Mesorhizobium sp. NZP2298]